MKLYTDIGGTAPSPRRVRMFLAEKGIEVPCESLKIHEENRAEWFLEKNPIGSLPVLELDDGTCISESMAICRYFEALHPEPPLFGTTPEEIGWIDMWARRAELYLYQQIDYASYLDEELESPKGAAQFRANAQLAVRFLEGILAERSFVAGPKITIADIIVFGALDFGNRFANFQLPSGLKHLPKWFSAMASRPSAQA